MKGFIRQIAMLLLFAATVNAQQEEVYIQLSDPCNLTKENANGVVLKSFRNGKVRQTPLMFRPGQTKVYFIPLDTAAKKSQAIMFTDGMIEDGTELLIQVFKASDKTHSLPKPVSPNMLPMLPPFLLSDGDLIVVQVSKAAETSFR
jgi:hypothetical protein